MSLEKRITAIEDRIAIKNVVDTFSVLADVKNVGAQVLLFTKDAVVQTVMNGQQTLTLNGDNAAGTSYCQVTLIGNENGKKMKTTFGIYYHDEFVKQNGRWLIAKRTSNFTWTDKTPLGQ